MYVTTGPFFSKIYHMLDDYLEERNLKQLRQEYYETYDREDPTFTKRYYAEFVKGSWTEPLE